MKKGLFVIILFVSFILNGFAQAKENPASDFEYQINKENTGILIMNYIGTSKNVVIPAKIDGKPVRILSGFADKQLNSVVIPNTVIAIMLSAFASNELTNIVIPNSVNVIFNNAFSNNKLKAVTIGNSVTKIANEAFKNNQLTSVVIPKSVTSIGKDAFDSNVKIIKQ